MIVNILLSNKIEGFVITETFNTNFSRLLIFCLSVKSFQKWMKSKSNSFISFLPFILNFMNSITNSNSKRINEQIRLEKTIINNYPQFWKFYFIEIEIITETKKSIKMSNLLKLFHFLLKFYLKCPNEQINVQSF